MSVPPEITEDRKEPPGTLRTTASQEAAQAFDLYQSGRYQEEVSRAEQAFYSLAELHRNPRLRLQHEKPPFLFAGNLEAPGEKWISWGINPKTNERDKQLPLPADSEEYYRRALTAFAGGVPSPYHAALLRVIAGVRGGSDPPSVLPREWLVNHYLTFDLLPYFSEEWGVNRWTTARATIARDHVQRCVRLLRGHELAFLLFNGKPFESLLTGDRAAAGALGLPFRERDRFTYASVTGKRHGGQVILGVVDLDGRNAPAAILTWFLSQTRPPFSAAELVSLGMEIRERQPGLRA